MPLNDNLKNQLKGLHEKAVANGGFTYANPLSPVISAFVKQGLATVDHDTKEAGNEKNVAIGITDAGLAELGLTPTADTGPAQNDPSNGLVTDAATGEALAGAAPAATVEPASVNTVKVVKPRIKPVIHVTGVRMAMPELPGRGGNFGGQGGAEIYPFASLAAPEPGATPDAPAMLDSFFVAKADDNPDPKKKLAGTISGANKRFKADPTGKGPGGIEGRRFAVVGYEKDEQHGVPGARVFRIK